MAWWATILFGIVLLRAFGSIRDSFVGKIILNRLLPIFMELVKLDIVLFEFNNIIFIKFLYQFKTRQEFNICLVKIL